MKKSNTSKKHPVPFYIAMITLCLLLFSTYLSGGIFARYTTSGSASDSARVAMFKTPTVTVVDSSLEINTYDGIANTASTTITVAMKTEVAVKYNIIVTCGRALPSFVALTLDGAEPTSSAGGVYTFVDAGTFNAGGDRSNSHTIAFTADLGWHDMSAETFNNAFSNVDIKVVATQID